MTVEAARAAQLSGQFFPPAPRAELDIAGLENECGSKLPVAANDALGGSDVNVDSDQRVGHGSSIIALPVVEALDLVPNHTSTPEIERMVFHGIPYLASVHTVTKADSKEREYCAPHDHRGQDELNLFLGTTDDFRFRVTLNGSEHILGPVAALLIPAGESHAANVLSGSGYYVVLKIPTAAG